MRKSIVLLMVIVTGGLVLSCALAQPNQTAQPNQPVPAKEYTESTQIIETSVRGQFTIALDANPTTGYEWEANFDTSILKLVGNEFRPAAAKPGMVGVGGEQRLTFRGLKEGTTEVTFTYKRPLEQTVADKKVFTIHIK